MSSPIRRFAVLLATAAATLAPHLPAAAQLAVKDPWVRGTVPEQKSSGAFMTLVADADAKLVEARSPVAGVVEIHEMRMDGGTMRMRAIDALDLPAGRAVALSPGGFHVMLIDLKRQLKPGETVPITLVLESKDRQRRTVEVQAPVRPLNAAAGGAAAGGHGAHGAAGGGHGAAHGGHKP